MDRGLEDIAVRQRVVERVARDMTETARDMVRLPPPTTHARTPFIRTVGEQGRAGCDEGSAAVDSWTGGCLCNQCLA